MTCCRGKSASVCVEQCLVYKALLHALVKYEFLMACACAQQVQLVQGPLAGVPYNAS